MQWYPVIAYGHGGSLETVNERKTELFFIEQTFDTMVEAINKFEAMGSLLFAPADCRQWAERFSEERLKEKSKSSLKRSMRNLRRME